jgi:uncharacterized protein YecT (DUF1311 family)
MKQLLIATCVSLAATFAFCQSTQSPCWKAATAQSEMNHCADLDARQADADLNRVYGELLSKLKNDANAIKKLRAAQRAWLAFKDAHLWMMSYIAPEDPRFTRDRQPDEAVFRAAAMVPALWMGVGVVREAPPFDVEEFLRLCGEGNQIA